MAKRSDDVIDLSGEWGFYEGILSPTEIGSRSLSYIQVPAYWSVGNKFRDFGTGLYHLKIKGAVGDVLALRLDRVHTNYSVWINDRLVHRSGNPSKDPKKAVPGIDNKPIAFKHPGGDFDVFIGVSNYWHTRGGIIKKVEIGKVSALTLKWSKGLIMDMAFVTVILAIALYSLVMFFMVHRQLPYLYFSLFCLLTVLRLISTESMIVGLVFPNTPYFLITLFRYVGLFMGTSLIGLYCRELIPGLSSHWIVKFFIGSGAVCSMGVMLGPTWWGSYCSIVFQVATFFSIAFFYVLTIKDIMNGRKDLILIFISITVINITFIHDVLVVAQVLPPGFWQMYGFTIASLFQLLYFAFEYKSLNQKVDSLHASFTSLGIIHREKREFEHLLINEIKGQLNSGDLDEGFLRSILKKINRGPSIPANQKVVIEAIDKVNQDFLIKLKKKYPNLTQKETELCLSLKAKLSTKEIAAIRNTTTDSVKKARSRLRQKLNVGKETDLYQFFESF